MTLRQMIECARVGCAISAQAGFYTDSERTRYIDQLQSFSRVWVDYIDEELDDLSIQAYPYT